MASSSHTYTEIVSQPTVWQTAVEEVAAQRAALEEFFSTPPPSEVLYVGCGSTYYGTLVAASTFQALTGIPARAVPASEVILFPDTVLPRSNHPLLIAPSRSGETSESIRAVEVFRERCGERVFTVCCEPESTLARTATFGLMLPAAMEKSVVQTRSYSTILLALQLTTAVIAGREDVWAQGQRLPAWTEGWLATHEATWESLADEGWRDVVLLGSGPLYGQAAEGKLVLTEMSLTPAQSYHFLEVRHGPKALVGGGTLVVGLLSEANPDLERPVLRELGVQGATTLACLPTEWPVDEPRPNYLFPLPEPLSDFLNGFPALMLIQTLAYFRAVGLNPDAPKNLQAVTRLDLA
jgi:glucosamine--fructose-6-phosphate aminotransferase (isomerizing)